MEAVHEELQHALLAGPARADRHVMAQATPASEVLTPDFSVKAHTSDEADARRRGTARAASARAGPEPPERRRRRPAATSVDAGGEEHRDQAHGAQVVGDGQGQQEDAQRLRAAAAPTRARAARAKAMSVAVGDRPALGVAARAEVERRGRSAPARPCRRRRRAIGRARRRGLESSPRRTSNLISMPDDQEEHRHQAVLDPVERLQRLGEVAEPDRDRRVRAGEIVRPTRASWRARWPPGGRGRQDRPGAGLGLQEIEREPSRHDGAVACAARPRKSRPLAERPRAGASAADAGLAAAYRPIPVFAAPRGRSSPIRWRRPSSRPRSSASATSARQRRWGWMR